MDNKPVLLIASLAFFDYPRFSVPPPLSKVTRAFPPAKAPEVFLLPGTLPTSPSLSPVAASAKLMSSTALSSAGPSHSTVALVGISAEDAVPMLLPCPAVNGKEKRENRKSGRSVFYETGEHSEGDGKTCPPSSPSFESPNSAHLYYYWIKEAESKNKKMKMKQRQRSRSNRYELSISSSFGEEGFGFFNSGETDTFFFSRSFFSVSSEFYRCHSPKSRKSSKKTEQSNKKKQDENSKFSNRRRRPATLKRGDNFINDFQPLVSISFSEENEAEKTHPHRRFSCSDKI